MNLLGLPLVAVAALSGSAAAFSSPAAVADHVAARAPSSAEEDPSSSLQLDRLHSWADSVGIRRSAAVADDSSAGGGRGLVATRDLAPGEVAVRVPLSATLRVVGGTSEIEEDDGWAGILASRLCRHDSLGASSPFYEYLTIGLPREAPRTVCRWTPLERLALQDDGLVNESFENAAWRRRRLVEHRRRRQLGGAIEGSDGDVAATSGDGMMFLHYLDLVCSRTLKGRDGSRNLVPIIDNANHAPSEAGGGSFKLDLDNDEICLMAGHRGVKQGRPVTLDYGARRLEDYLLHYGFVPDRCPGDAIRVSLPSGGDEGGEGRDAVVATVRWEDCAYDGHADASVREACARVLESFDTSLGEDVGRLAAGGGPGDDEAARAALEYRIAKKSLLERATGVRLSEAAFSAWR